MWKEQEGKKKQSVGLSWNLSPVFFCLEIFLKVVLSLNQCGWQLFFLFLSSNGLQACLHLKPKHPMFISVFRQIFNMLFGYQIFNSLTPFENYMTRSHNFEIQGSRYHLECHNFWYQEDFTSDIWGDIW